MQDAEPRPVSVTWDAPSRRWLILAAAVFGLFMAILDASIVAIATPSIEQGFKTDIETATWVLNAYNLVFAVLLIPAGRVADRFGRKKLFLVGIVIFTVFSLACGLAGSIELLIACRAFQAVGAAIMVPVSLAIVTVAFPPQQRGLAVGVWGAISGAAGAIGPTLGGLLTEYAGWEWIFFVNIPVGVLAVAACFMFIPESRDLKASHRVDLPGLATLSGALFTLTLALIRGEAVGWSSPFIVGLFAAFAVFTLLFVVVEHLTRDPLVDLRMLRQRTFGAASIAVLLFGFGFFGALFLFIQYLVVVEGYSVLRAALSVTPLPAAIIVVGPIAGRLSDRYGPHTLVVTGVATFGLAMFFFSRFAGGESYWDMLWPLIVAGIGAGLAFPPLTSAAMGSIGGGRQGVGAGVFNTARQVGFTLGLAVLVAVFVGTLHPRLADASIEANTLVQQSDLPAPVQQGIIQGIASATSAKVGQGAISGEQQKFDLYDSVEQAAGATVADANRATLDRLSRELKTVFAQAAADAFDRAFLVAAIILWFGVIPAYFVKRAPDTLLVPPSTRPPPGP
jgi:EmrB/QacA subfamily drug resistance transporter